MKNLILVFAAICGSIINSNAQQFELAKRIGGTDEDRANKIAVDALGNIIVSGAYSGTVNFKPGTTTDIHSATGGKDLFVAKFDPNGQFLWVQSNGGVFDDYVQDVAIDDSGYVYITGFVGLSSDLKKRAMIIAKIDTDGSTVWSQTINSNNNQVQGSSIEVDSAGNIFVAGSFDGKVNFNQGGGTDELTTSGTLSSADAFVLKLTNSGLFNWVKQFSVTSHNVGVADLAIDASGNIYSTGNFWNGSMDADPGPATATLSNNGSGDIFVSKLDANGNYVWARSFGSSSTNSDYGLSIDVDGVGNVYTTGWFSGSDIDFDPASGPGNVVNLASAGGRDVFVSKLDANGDYVWAKKIGTTSEERGNSLKVDAAGNVFITGMFEGVIDLDPGTGTHNITSKGSRDIFVSRYETNGEFTWAHSIGSVDDDIAASIFLNESNQLYITGSFKDTIDVDPNSGTTELGSQGNREVFFARWSLCSIDASTIVNGNKITSNSAGVSYQWIDCDNGNAPISGETSQTFQATSNGNYAVIVSDGNCSVTSECVAIANLGVSDVGSSRGIVLFPNPTKGSFQLTVPNFSDALISIFNSSGQLVKTHTMTSQQEQIELHESEGIYLVKVQTAETIETFRLVKQ